jgi:ribosomal protein S18 acetylase RimI-like enzyme
METPEEFEGKAFVHYQSWQQTYRGQLCDDYLDQMSLEKCLAIARRWPERTLIAKVDGRVVGFSAYGPYRDDTLPNTGEIHALYLLKEYQKRGIGYALMTAAIEKLRESAYDQAALWVLKGNQNAIPFYEQFGFRFDGCEKSILIGEIVTEQRMLYSLDK